MSPSPSRKSKTAVSKELNSKNSKVSYEELGRMLTNIYESGYIDRNKSYKQSFIKGVLSGFGGVLGATILVGLLLWILSFFKSVPVVNRVVNNFRNTVQTERP